MLKDKDCNKNAAPKERDALKLLVENPRYTAGALANISI